MRLHLEEEDNNRQRRIRKNIRGEEKRRRSGRYKTNTIRGKKLIAQQPEEGGGRGESRASNVTGNRDTMGG